MHVFRPANLPKRSDGFQAVNIRQHCDLSRSALDREHLFDLVDLVGLAAVDGRLAAFVVKRVDDYFEFSVAIQIKDCTFVTSCTDKALKSPGRNLPFL
jgi:hypothetical protein